MNGGRSGARRERENRGCDITLRGLRFREAGGVFVPWLNLGLHTPRGACVVWAYDDKGERLRVGRRSVRWSVPFAQQRTVERMVRRAHRQALATGEFNVVEKHTGNRRLDRVGVAVWMLLAFGGVGAMGWHMVRGALGSSVGLPVSLRIVSIAAVALFIGLPAVLFGALGWMIAHIAWCNVARLRANNQGLEATLDNGSVQGASWEEVVSIRRIANTYVIVLPHGVVLRTAFRRVAFVLDDWMQRVAGTPSDSKMMKGVLIRSFGLCQIGGIAAAWLVWSGWGQSVHTPLSAYLVIGWVLPAGLWLHTQIPSLLDWIGRRGGRKSRARERQRRAGRIA